MMFASTPLSMQAKLRNQAQIKNGIFQSKPREGLREKGRLANVG